MAGLEIEVAGSSTTVTDTDTGTPEDSATLEIDVDQPGGEDTDSAMSSSTTASSTTATAVAAPVGPCGRQSGTNPEVLLTDLDLPTPFVWPDHEGDTARLPLAVTEAPIGGSWLTWLTPDNGVALSRLDCDDMLIGEPVYVEGVDLQDILADEDGVVVLLTRKGDCGDGQLCGGEPSPCFEMWMVRFDNAGQVLWEQQVTNLVDGRTGYDAGAAFVWWYQHHGRLATDGDNYAAYFAAAFTIFRSGDGGCVDIHQGDRMQVVSRRGEPRPDHPDSFAGGCSHSWQTRIVWDPVVDRFTMICTTDNYCRIAQPNPYRTVAEAECNGTLFGGDLILAPGGGYWAAWSLNDQARIDRFSTGETEQTVRTDAATRHPHLVTYSNDRMLLSWEKDGRIAAQVYSATSGEPEGQQLTIDANDHNFLSFKQFADGSAAYAAVGDGSDQVRIVRVLPIV